MDDATLRLKAPSTTTLRWLLPRLGRFRHLNPDIEVQLTSAWMDVDSVDFQREPFDCAVLLGSGQFSPEWETAALFAEWLVPVCDPDEAVEPGPSNACVTASCCTTPDRRDWRRWLQRTGLGDEVSLKGGQVFDTLELGIVAAARGYGVSIGDLVMVAEDVAQGRIGLPWPVAVASGEAITWSGLAPARQERFQRLRDFLLAEVAAMRLPVVERLA
ncbi:LysR substrate-binding domain-containing protein [Pseudomonas aeruginosa]|nr:LysR substrate-binding domain-containing protein [Pseudomonas aeruginosa]